MCRLVLLSTIVLAAWAQAPIPKLEPPPGQDEKPTFGVTVVDSAGLHGQIYYIDNGSVLYIDGKHVIDNDGLHSPQSMVGAHPGRAAAR